MGGKGKLPVASLNKPGQGGQEAHLRETLSRFSQGRFEAPFPCSFHPHRGTRGDVGRKQGKQMMEAERDGSGERSPVAAALVRGAEKPGTSVAAAATALSLSAGRDSCWAPAEPLLALARGLEVPAGEVPQQTLNGEMMRAQST